MDVIEKIFRQNPQISSLYKTRDGQVFFNENYAVLHDKEHKPELIKREDVLVFSPVDVPVFSPVEKELTVEEELTGDEFEPEMLVEELPKAPKPKK